MRRQCWTRSSGGPGGVTGNSWRGKGGGGGLKQRVGRTFTTRREWTPVQETDVAEREIKEERSGRKRRGARLPDPQLVEEGGRWREGRKDSFVRVWSFGLLFFVKA